MPGIWELLLVNHLVNISSDRCPVRKIFITDLPGLITFIDQSKEMNRFRYRSFFFVSIPLTIAAFGLSMRQSGSDATPQKNEDYQLVWSDEFNNDGRPDTSKWHYEQGFVRNHELQWYQPENAWCEGGRLIIEARKEQRPNPNFEEGSSDWKKSRRFIEYTSSCLLTRKTASWQYGRFEMRGKIDIRSGLWPAWWTLGVSKRWPGNGEIDIMEYYRGHLLANIACADKQAWKAKWYGKKFPTDSMGGKAWADQFHVWRMDWSDREISLYLDDQLLNRVPVDSLYNRDGSGFNPFRQPHFMLLNLAIGGDNGGDPSGTSFPNRFEVDYVRVYQRKTAP
jgi:beta-glucanase (GH16 family)